MKIFEILGVEPTLDISKIDFYDILLKNECKDTNEFILAYYFFSEVVRRETKNINAIQSIFDSVDDSLNRLPTLVEENNHIEILAVVLKQVRKKPLTWYQGSPTFDEAIKKAILQGKTAIVRFFLIANVNPNHLIKTEKNPHLDHPLLSGAVEANNLNIIILLVSYGAKIKSHTMTRAIKLNQTAIIDCLLVLGGDPNAYKNKSGNPITALSQAALNLNREIVRLLVLRQASMLNALKYLAQGFYKNQKAKYDYSLALKLCLDFSVGVDISYKIFFEFLSKLDVTDFNFIGVSFNGKPVTPEILKKMGCKGVEQAIFKDANKIVESERKQDILTQLNNLTEQRGLLVDNDKIINLVPLDAAVAGNDIRAIKTRLNAGTLCSKEISPQIVIAAEKGFMETVELLLNTGKIDNEFIIMAYKAVRISNSSKIEDLISKDLLFSHLDLDTQLFLKVGEGDLFTVKKLVEDGATINFNVIHATIIDQRLFWEPSEKIIVQKYNNILEFLLQKNVKLNLEELAWVLERAVENDNPGSLRLLTDYFREKHFENYMLAYDTVIEPLKFEATTKDNDIELLTILKQNGANFHKTDDKHGYSMLYRAVCRLTDCYEDENIKKAFALIQFLLENGTDFSLANQNGDTPFDLFIGISRFSEFFGEKYVEILDYFIKNGANIYSINSKNRSVLETAKEENNSAAVHVLEQLISETANDSNSQEQKANRSAALILQSIFAERRTNIKDPQKAELEKPAKNYCIIF